MSYKPPYKITPKIITLIEQIGEVLGVLALDSDVQDLRLRRVHRIQTIRGSLAIEGNTLSEDQISTILDGKPVVAPLREVQEVRNAIKAYDEFHRWNPTLQRDLLKAHETLMLGLLDAPGHFRSSGVGVGSAEGIVHIAPPAERVPELMGDLFEWLGASGEHALVKSCVFHYEFEFIHPFADGNGRVGRLWQTLILSRWNPLFAQIPIESMVYAHQQDYYSAIAQSTKEAESTPFVEFMLQVILEKAMECSRETPQVDPQVTPQVERLLPVLAGEMSRAELVLELGLKDRMHVSNEYLKPALEARLIEMTVPDKPNSRLQKYRLTEKGRKFLENQQNRGKK
jgi:Fic family protein